MQRALDCPENRCGSSSKVSVGIEQGELRIVSQKKAIREGRQDG